MTKKKIQKHLYIKNHKKVRLIMRLFMTILLQSLLKLKKRRQHLMSKKKRPVEKTLCVKKKRPEKKDSYIRFIKSDQLYESIFYFAEEEKDEGL